MSSISTFVFKIKYIWKDDPFLIVKAGLLFRILPTKKLEELASTGGMF